jgi:hypothetical protein
MSYRKPLRANTTPLGKAILLAMARLLGSGDQEAQLRAVQFFGKYTIFADAQGNMRDSGPQGPLYAAADLIKFASRRGWSKLGTVRRVLVSLVGPTSHEPGVEVPICFLAGIQAVHLT